MILQMNNYCALCFNEAPCSPAKTGFPPFYNKPSRMRSLLQFNFPRQRRKKQKEDEMKKTISLAVCALFVVVMMSAVAFLAEKGAAMQKQETILTGITNNANQLVDNYGQTFDVGDNEECKELVNHVGKKVQVKITELESEGQKQIPNQHRYHLTVKGIKLTNILNVFLTASTENLVKMVG
jgi:hypothetical protein